MVEQMIVLPICSLRPECDNLHTDTNKIYQTRCANGNANDCRTNKHTYLYSVSRPAVSYVPALSRGIVYYITVGLNVQ